MRKIDVALAGAAILTLSVTGTLYFINHPVGGARSEKMDIGLSKTGPTLSPDSILTRSLTESAPPDETAELQIAPLSHGESQAAAQPVIFPEWQPGATRIQGAQPITEQSDFVRPVWSPVGLDVAFTHKNLSSIFISGAHSGTARLLTDDANVGADFGWNFDGMSLHLAPSDGESYDVMITGEKYPAEEWNKKVFVRDDLIYFRAETAEPRLVSGRWDRFSAPIVSPDETRVVYVGRATGLYITTLDSLRTIFVGSGQNPSWLPDSSGIVYEEPVRDDTGIVDADLFFADVTGRQRTNITNTPGIAEGFPAVAPDGERIAFSSSGAIYVGRFVRPQEVSGR